MVAYDHPYQHLRRSTFDPFALQLNLFQLRMDKILRQKIFQLLIQLPAKKKLKTNHVSAMCASEDYVYCKFDIHIEDMLEHV